MSWASGNKTNSIGVGDVIADTGPLSATSGRQIAFAMNATVTCNFKCQSVDADGSTIPSEQEATCLSGTSAVIPMPALAMLDQQRMRVVTNSVVTLGRVSCSVFYGD